MATHSSTLVWTEEPGGLQSMGSLRVGHDWATSLSLFHFHALEKEMATHSSVLAWRIPGAGEPGGLTSMGSHRVGHVWSDLAVAAGKTTRPFRYDLNQIPYDYTVEVRNRFKGLDLIECLMNYGWRFVTVYRRQGSRPSPRKKKCKKAKWLSEEALQIAEERREAKGKGEKER